MRKARLAALGARNHNGTPDHSWSVGITSLLEGSDKNLFSWCVKAVPTCQAIFTQPCPSCPVVDTQCKWWYTSQRRNPDHDAHKDAFLVSIQDPSLAAGELNALGIGNCAFVEPILHGSALAFLTLGTVLTKNANLYQTESGVGWHAGHRVKTSRQPGGNVFIVSSILILLYLRIFVLSIVSQHKIG